MCQQGCCVHRRGVTGLVPVTPLRWTQGHGSEIVAAYNFLYATLSLLYDGRKGMAPPHDSEGWSDRACPCHSNPVGFNELCNKMHSTLTVDRCIVTSTLSASTNFATALDVSSRQPCFCLTYIAYAFRSSLSI